MLFITLRFVSRCRRLIGKENNRKRTRLNVRVVKAYSFNGKIGPEREFARRQLLIQFSRNASIYYYYVSRVSFVIIGRQWSGNTQFILKTEISVGVVVAAAGVDLRIKKLDGKYSPPPICSESTDVGGSRYDYSLIGRAWRRRKKRRHVFYDFRSFVNFYIDRFLLLTLTVRTYIVITEVKLIIDRRNVRR